MKKIFVAVMLCAFTMTNVTVYAQSAKQLKAERKAVAARVKEITKYGYKVLGNEDLVKLISTQEEKKRNNNYLIDWMGISSGYDLNQVKYYARKNAARTAAEIYIKVNMEDICDTIELRKIYGAKIDTLITCWKSALTDKIADKLELSFYTYKESINHVNKKLYDIEGYFLLDYREGNIPMLYSLIEASEKVGIPSPIGIIENPDSTITIHRHQHSVK